jgi:hypothetical protein
MPMSSIDLRTLVADELNRIRKMDPAEVFRLPAHASRDLEQGLMRRVSVSLFVEHIGADAVRVIAKAFFSRFPHISSNGYGDGFRLSSGGLVSDLTSEDRETLY